MPISRLSVPFRSNISRDLSQLLVALSSKILKSYAFTKQSSFVIACYLLEFRDLFRA